ncbi:hypothetical protein EST38_g6961 [Candolleomyces aberdarensis]|uniref:Uncharacterized protein n=1 Tax=Candolleomyces aberdarensis TaxID=2316362 RepID=A0A4Q2DGE2_9AGAR|nr:hypothetical protein EST38_g6961 [Candolleomyces aberdarensis]
MQPCNAIYHFLRLLPNAADGNDGDVNRFASKHTQRAIVALANVAWDLGLDIVLPRLSTFLTPFSAVYRTDDQRDARSYAENASALFMWIPAQDVFKTEFLPSAQYAVAFSVVCERPFHTICLAYAIAHFQEAYIDVGGQQHFTTLSICYGFNSYSVYGVFFYGQDFKRAYGKVLRQCQRGAQNSTIYRKYPVTLWPPSQNVGVTAGSYDALLTRVGRLLPEGSWLFPSH